MSLTQEAQNGADLFEIEKLVVGQRGEGFVELSSSEALQGVRSGDPEGPSDFKFTARGG